MRLYGSMCEVSLVSTSCLRMLNRMLTCLLVIKVGDGTGRPSRHAQVGEVCGSVYMTRKLLSSCMC